MSPPLWALLRTQVDGQEYPMYELAVVGGRVQAGTEEFAPVILFEGSTRTTVAPNTHDVQMFVFPTRDEAAEARP